MKYDVYLRSAEDPACNSEECVMWVVTEENAVWFTADGRVGCESLYMVMLGLLDSPTWDKTSYIAEDE